MLHQMYSSVVLALLDNILRWGFCCFLRHVHTSTVRFFLWMHRERLSWCKEWELFCSSLFTVFLQWSDISRKEISTGCFWHLHRNPQDILESRPSKRQTMWQLQPNWQWSLVTGRVIITKHCRKRWTVPEPVPRPCFVNWCSYTWESWICSLGWIFTKNRTIES